MRKSFTRLFGFLLLNVMMLFSFGLYAQESQSTVELKAPIVAGCYNASNSYTATVSTRDFIAMKSFDLTLNYDKSEFGVTSITPVAALGGSFTWSADAVTGKINVKWTNTTAVSLGDNAYANLFAVNFNVLGWPNNTGDNLFDSPLTWDAASKFYYGASWTGSYQVSTTAFVNGSLDVTVSYTDIQYVVTPATCSGGQAVITITNPIGTGLQYYFNGSATASTSPVATADAPSVNTVRIKDANGCYSHLFSIPVTAPEPLVFIGASTETPTCFGENGEIQFSISGGTPSYTYWVVPAASSATFQTTLTAQGGATSAPYFTPFKYTNFQVLKPSGTYSVTVSDAGNCTDLGDPANWKTVTIGAAPAQIDFATTTNTITCNGSTDGTIMVGSVTGGTASPTGSYSASINGVNWFAVSTGTPTYTFSNLAAGTYTVTVKDFNGCTTAKAVTIKQPTAITYTLTFQDVACGGTATPTGSITITGVSGGTATYTFAVAVSGTVTSTSGPSTGWVAAPGTIGSLSAGYYSIWVKDANGCVKAFVNPDGSGNALPIQAPGALAFTTSADNAAAVEVTCYGGTYTLTVSASGGTAPYSYSYNSGSTTTSTSYVVPGPLNADASVIVVVTDASGCSLTKTVTVDVPTELTVSLEEIGADDEDYLPPTCPGGNDGRVIVLASGGTTPYSYSTNNVNWFSNNVLAVPEGVTNIYVKDAKGCMTSTNVNVTSLTASTVTATADLITCHGAKTSEIHMVTTWQASRTVQYLIASSAEAVYTSGSVFEPAGTTTPTTFIAGTYYIGARDEYGCTSNVIMIQIKENPLLQLAASATNATCFGLNDGTLTINTSGGNGWPSYAIVNNSIALGNLQNSDFLTFPVGTYSATTSIGHLVVQAQRGTYYIAIKDGCDDIISDGPFTVDGYKAITFTGTVSKTNITCHDSNNGTITVPLAGVKGGKPEFDTAGDYTFTLYKPAGGTVTNTTGAFTGLAGGSYTITITDASGCSASSTISNITIVNPSPVVLTVTNVTHFTCKDSRDGQIAVSAAGGNAGYWLAVNAVNAGDAITADNSNWIAFGTTSATIAKTYIATEPGVYYLYIKDANGCIGNTVSVTVLEPAVLVPTVGTVTNVTCAGLSTGAAQINVTGGWSPTVSQTYQFKVGTTTNTTGLFTGLAAGTYSAKVTVSAGTLTNGIYVYPKVACEYSVPFTITQPVPYSYSAITENVKCKGDSNGALTVTVIGGSATTTTTGDEYYVQLTGTATPTLSSTGWKLTVGKSYKFDNLAHGIYSIWIGNKSDGSGCLLPTGTETPTAGVFTKVASWEVNEPSTALTVSATISNNVTCNGGNNGKYVVNAVGGVAPYTYASKISTWPTLQLAPDPSSSDWKTSNVFDTATAATWVIWVKDANGCIVGGEGTIIAPVLEYRVIITQPLAVSFNTSISNATCFGTADGKITVTPVVSAGAPYTYTVTGKDYAGNTVSMTGTTTATSSFVISNIPANKTIGSTATNVYTVTLTDKNGCTKSSTTTVITQKPVLDVRIVKADGSFVCPGDNSGTIEAIATGGSGTYAYRLWRDGVAYTSWVNIPSFLVQVGHTWKVEVSDNQATPASGCLDSDEQVINEPVGITATMQETTCFGDLNASVIIKAVGNTGRTFQYQFRANSETTYSAWANVTDQPVSGFIFANQLVEQNFYYFNVKDNMGCTTSFTYSFVPTQNELQATVAGVGGSVSVTVTGGIAPYSYMVGTASKTTITGSVSGGSYAVAGLVDGTNTITIYDNHGCSKVVTYVADLMAPTAVTYSPNGTTTPTTNNHPALVITFSENVAVGTGSVKIMKKSDNTLAIPAIASSAITVSGKTATVTYAGGLDKNVEYYVLVDNGVVKDLAGNAFAGVTATSTWTFKTGNTFVTPVPEPINNSLEFKVYPNPFVDNVNIDNASELSKVVVSNIAGQVVKEVVNPTSTIQLDQLVSGVYFISLYQDGVVVKTVKIVKR